MSKFTPSPQEVALVNQIFTQADAQKLGVVNGDTAVKIFSGSKLPSTVLAEVWNLADEDHKGVLTRKDVAVAVRLLGHAQRGDRVTEAHIHKPGAVPSIEGLNVPLSGQLTGSVRSTKSPPPGAASGLPPLTPQDKTKFAKLFTGYGPVNGLLPGEKARDVFVKSKLPVDKLSQIWTLADTKNRGVLDTTDFTIAMYLIQACMSGQLQTVPQTLPPFLYDQAKPDGVLSHPTGGSSSFSPTSLGGFHRPASTAQPQLTGTTPLQAQTTGHRPTPLLPSRTTSIPAFPVSSSAAPQVQWDIAPAEKATSDQFFDSLDTQKRGYIEGDVAVPFMVQSKLPDDVLAQIWDLSDLNNDGRLTQDGFAVAMHLIQGKLVGKEVPATLPPTLVPPSMRHQTSHPPVLETIKDLLWDDTPPQSATTSQPPAPSFPPAPAPATPARANTISPQHTAAQVSPPVSNIFGATDPFASTSFGSSLAAAASPPPASTIHRDLLGDDDEPVASSPPLQDKSAEIGNVQNQFHSTNRALETAKNEREDLEKKLAEQASQLSALQTQLSTAKASYETETRLLTTLRERFSTQNTDIQKARQELIRAESDLSAVRVEKAEVEGSFLRDKEEVRELQRKMTEVGSEVEMVKAEIEKAKKEAKQQKGLLAIAKKQLVTREAERAKVQRELAEAQAEVQAATKEREDAEAELAKVPEPAPIPAMPERVASPASDMSSLLFAAAQPLPASPDPSITSPGSPATSVKSTNPFERLAIGTSPRSQSPFVPFSASPIVPVATGGSAHAAPSIAASAGDPAGDPFGFEEAFGTEAQEQPAPEDAPAVEEPTSATTETSQAESSPFEASERSVSTHEEASSPMSDGDHFMTPPSTATIPATRVMPTVEDRASPEQHEESSRFPDISAAGTSEALVDEDTDLNVQLKELEVDESSDSDSEDDEPLDHVKAKLKSEATPQATSPSTTAGPSTSAFDDSFGISSPLASATVTISTPPAQASASPAALDTPKASAIVSALEPAKSSETPQTTPDTAGVSDFDEALGKLSGSSQFSHVSQYTFDSAFDDDFDFAAAKAASSPSPTATTAAAFPPAQTVGFDAVFLPQASGGAQPAPVSVSPTSTSPFFPAAPTAAVLATSNAAQSRPFSFEDAFGSVANTAPQNNASAAAPSNGTAGISFDDAFGGIAPSEALAFDNSFPNTNTQPSAGNAPPLKTSNTPFPTSSGPSSPVRATSPSARSGRSYSPPPRQASPPPRITSPRPRPSTASSDKEKEKSTRHSKLSIRLPFGRKKAKHDPMPSHLSQSHLAEESFANGATPAADDDIEAVKTLCSMGFSRTQAVTALEQYDYDVQRALNSLLGTR